MTFVFGRRFGAALCAVVCAAVLGWSASAFAQAAAPAAPVAAAKPAAAPAAGTAAGDVLKARLTPDIVKKLFPGEVDLVSTPGRPPAVEVRSKGANGTTLGYIFSTLDVVNATGYAGKAFDFIAGITPDGVLTGVVLAQHSETIIGRGVPQERLDQFIAGFAGATIQRWGGINPDLLAGASISGRAFKAGMQSAALRVYNAHILGEAAVVVTEPQLDRNGFSAADAKALLEKGAITGVNLTVRDAIKLFEKAGGTGAKPDLNAQQMANLDGTFLDYKVALVSPAAIGNNMFGDTRYREIVGREGSGGLSIWMGDKGYSSFVSNSHLRASLDFVFDQVKIVQGKTTIKLHAPESQRLLVASAFAGDLLPSRESMVFTVPKTAGLDPLQPWTAVLTQPGFNAKGEAMTIEIPVAYNLPDNYKLLPPPVERPAYVEIWENSVVDVSILGALLLAVTLVFVLQDVLAKNRMAYNIVRVGLLTFTLVWLGWWVGGQYSIINILAYMMAPFTGTGLDTFLLDPLFFILTIYIVLTLFVLGRGVFCGWLCPFGALQELTNKIAILLHVPQLKIAPAVQERLWAVKYLAAAVIIGVGFYSIDMANDLDELEPFKTAITVHFLRELPFVLYAVALLVAGLFIERFYCRFLCPLGGALGVFGRMHMFKWLKRKPQCGTQCRICETDCPVGAIEPSGQINMNECLQCLDCQVDYYDNERCPPLIARKKRKDARTEAGIGGVPMPAPAE